MRADSIFTVVAFLTFTGTASARSYTIAETLVGKDFLSGFRWETFDDPTHGRVNYVDQTTALSNNLTFATNDKFIMRAENTRVVPPNARGRDSVRITSYSAYGDAVAVIDVEHLPFGCAVWPALWTLSQKGPWPHGAEIDIIEGVNRDTQNIASLHTTSNCTMPQYRAQSGFTVSENCDAAFNYNQGCGTRFSKANSYGSGFNQAGGGWFAMAKSREEGVKVWFWSRPEEGLPREIRDGSVVINPDYWGMPDAMFPRDTCDYDSHFDAHEMIIDVTLCGDWAGDFQVYAASNCPGKCEDFVDNNPTAFDEAYWEINSIRIYEPLVNGPVGNNIL